MTTLYERLVGGFGPAVRRYCQIEVLGADNLPPSGHAGLLACNHSGQLWWDGVCLASALPQRKVRFIAHHWDANVPGVGFFLKAIGAHFLAPDLEALDIYRPEVRALLDGRLLLQYPEESYHTFRDRYTLFRFAPQIIKYAQLGNAPIIPVAVIGVEEAAAAPAGYKPAGVPLHIPYLPPVFLPLKVTVSLGAPQFYSELTGLEPSDPAGPEDYQRGADKLRLKVQELILPHRYCKLDDRFYNQQRSWI